jgi:hypothetical protein
MHCSDPSPAFVALKIELTPNLEKGDVDKSVEICTDHDIECFSRDGYDASDMGGGTWRLCLPLYTEHKATEIDRVSEASYDAGIPITEKHIFLAALRVKQTERLLKILTHGRRAPQATELCQFAVCVDLSNPDDLHSLLSELNGVALNWRAA